MDQLLTIGALADRCGLSRSALRFYDQCGLLKPVVVDETTGYRYYEEAQAEVAHLVRRLRGAEVPVTDVRAFLAAGIDERRTFLESHRVALEARLVSAQAMLDELEKSMMDNEYAPTPECTIGAQALALALGQVLFAASKDPGRPELAGVLVECKDGSLRLVTSDSYRLAVRDIVPEEITDGARLRAIIGTADAVALEGRLAAGGRCVLRQGAGGGLDVALEGEVVALPALPGEFPDYESVLLGLPSGHHCLVGRSDLVDAVSHAAGSLATLRFVRRELQIGTGDDMLTVPSDWDGPEVEILLNADFMAEALVAHLGPDIAIEVVAPLRPITFRSADAGTFSVLVMPVRPRDNETAETPA
jgi:DNA-binding transcriptional MerR regulator